VRARGARPCARAHSTRTHGSQVMPGISERLLSHQLLNGLAQRAPRMGLSCSYRCRSALAVVLSTVAIAP